MGSRGRKSGADLAVIDNTGVVAVRRPEPLDELTDEQAAEWRAIVNAYEAGKFPRGRWPLLAQWCRHTVASRRIAQLIEKAEAAPKFDAAKYDKLLKMQERQSAALMRLSLRLGIGDSAVYDRKGSEQEAGDPPPWEFEG